MDNQFPISIITINFNNAKGLAKTMQSVLAQTYKHFEYIVIDGGSTDGSVEIIQQYSNQLTYWVSEKDNGIYNAMNKGWRNATGEYCLFLNSGDYLVNENILELVAEKMNSASVDIFFGDVANEVKEKRVIDKFCDYPSLYFMSYAYFPHCSSFISKKLLQEFNGYDETYSVIADRVFFTKAIIEAKSFVVLKTLISVFEGGGVSSKGLQIHKAERERLVKQQFPFLERENNNFKRLRYYELSRIHKVVNKILNFFGKGI